MEGPGSYAEAVEALGVTTLRYPGGSLTEYFFDLSNPDADTARHALTGEVKEFMPISDIMAHSAETGRPVAIVIPTRDQISERYDDNGDRLPAIEEDVLREFVRDVVGGVYGRGEVAAFEIGNEYWGSGGMTAAEYGRVAAEMTGIIDSELTRLAQMFPEANDIEIVVQMGTNFGSSSLDEAYAGMGPQDIAADLEATYDIELRPGAVLASGFVDWSEVNNEIILARLEESGALAQVDGVAAHIYSRAPVLEHTRYFHLDQIEDTWLEDRPDLEVHVTEWNQRSGTAAFDRSEDYGLYQAQEMLEMVEEYMRAGVDQAQVWPLIQNTPSTLSVGRSYESSTPAGEMFALMSENLPGMRMLDFAPADDREGEFEARSMDVHGFADGRDMLLYVRSNTREKVIQKELELSNLVEDVGAVEISVLGVAQGQAPGDSRSEAVVERADAEDLYVDGMLETILAPGEIMQVRLIDVTPTRAFEPVFAATAREPAPKTVPTNPPEPELDDVEIDLPDFPGLIRLVGDRGSDGGKGGGGNGNGGGGGGQIDGLELILSLMRNGSGSGAFREMEDAGREYTDEDDDDRGGGSVPGWLSAV